MKRIFRRRIMLQSHPLAEFKINVIANFALKTPVEGASGSLPCMSVCVSGRLASMGCRSSQPHSHCTYIGNVYFAW